MPRGTWFDKAVVLASRPDASHVDLALALAFVRGQGRGKLKRFAEKSGMILRKVYYLAEVGGKLKQVRGRKAQLERIGWTKLQIIAKDLNRENADELFALAESHTCHQLKGLMPGGDAEAKTHCVLMYFSPEQYEKFVKAILNHGGERRRRGLVKKEVAILNIIASLPNASRTASSP